MRILLDTNSLVRLRDADHPRHAVCAQAARLLQQGEHLPCVCAQVLIEYWVVATRPREVNGLGLTTAEAEEDLTDFARAYVWLREPPDLVHRWRALVNQHAVRGRPAHDARLVAVMQAHGLNHLLTLNPADFKRYSGMVSVSPEEVLAGSL